MSTEITLLAAFMTGLLGSVHCVGMCGGIVGSLNMGISLTNKNPRPYLLGFNLLYNIGRLSSYVIAGLIAAGIGESSSSIFTHNTQQFGAWLSGIFMILLGFYIAGWWQALSKIESIGHLIWKHIQPIGNKLLPVKSFSQAFMLGALWGWLPCGMVYAMLVFALSSQDMLQGGLIMLAFGLGTLPTLLLLGTAAATMKQFLQKPIVRQLAGSLIILFGVYNLVSPNSHEHHSDSHQHMQH